MKNNWIDVLDESLVKDFIIIKLPKSKRKDLILHRLLARLVLEGNSV